MLNNYNCCMVADRMRLAQVNWETKSAVINDPLEWFWGSLKEAKLPTSGCHLFGQQTQRNRIKNIFFFSPVTKSACFAWNARTMLDLWDSGHFPTLDAWLSHTAVRASLEVCFCRSVGETVPATAKHQTSSIAQRPTCSAGAEYATSRSIKAILSSFPRPRRGTSSS